MKFSTKPYRKKHQGFSLVELMFAMVVLTVAILGGMLMVSMGMLRNNTNKLDTTATNVAQTVLEDIAGTDPTTANTLTVTDCLLNNLSINTAGSTATAGAGAQLKSDGSGDIDFTESAATPAANNYQMNYTVCGSNGLQTVYDVRWNIRNVGPAAPTGNTYGKMVTVSARQVFVNTSKGIAFIEPVTLRTIVGM